MPRKNLSAMWAEGFTMKADELVVDNQKIEIAGMKITVIETPGHTLGGVCYYIERNMCCLREIRCFSRAMEEQIFLAEVCFH
mgnify:CR=1 FL=1